MRVIEVVYDVAENAYIDVERELAAVMAATGEATSDSTRYIKVLVRVRRSRRR